MQKNVPWSKLFPKAEIIRDSQSRQAGYRHYRVKIYVPHSKFEQVKEKLIPYGFTLFEKWTTGQFNYRGDKTSNCFNCIKAIRQTPL